MLPAASSETSAAVAFAPEVRSRVAVALLQTALVACAAVLGATEPSDWVAWLVLVGQLPMAVIRWRAVRNALHAPWSLRVDAEGVRWSPDGRALPWSDVAEVEVRLARGLRRLLPHLTCVLLVTPVQADFARRARTKPIGHVIRLAHVRATSEELVEAFRRFTDAPVRLRLR